MSTFKAILITGFRRHMESLPDSASIQDTITRALAFSPTANLQLEGSTGKELREMWQTWPPGKDWCVEDMIGMENPDNGEWLLQDDEFYTIDDIRGFEGHLIPQSLSNPKDMSWDSKSILDVWLWWKDNNMTARKDT